jgi:hypothetical protein
MANPNKIKNGGSGTKVGNFIRRITGKPIPVKPKTLPPLGGPTKPTKPVSVITSGGAKKVVNNIQNTINDANKAPVGDLAKFDKNRSDLESTLSDIETGGLSASERRQIRNARSLMSQEIEAQKLENKNFEAGTAQMGIRSGRQRYASEIQSGYQNAAVSSGIQKVQNLNIEMESKIAEMEADLRAGKIKEARDKYKEYNDFITERRALVKSIAIGASTGNAARSADFLKKYEQYVNTAKAAGNTPLSQSDYAIVLGDSEDAAASPTTITQEYADQYGLPSAIVGTSTAEIVNSLASNEVPSWFTQAYAENAIGYNTAPGKEVQALQSAWNQFRRDPQVLASMPPQTTTSNSNPQNNSTTTASNDDLDSLINELD